MENFRLYIPVKYYFGRGQISHLKQLCEPYESILLVYGGGSIKRNGVYDAVMNELKGKKVTECPGVEANPSVETVERGIALLKENHCALVIAAGGGSVMDAAKAICAGACWDGDVWDMVTHPKDIEKSLPLITIPTAAATGSELNSTSVISNHAQKKKNGFVSDALYPIAAIADPTYTFSVSARQTRAGAADTMSHIMEDYFKPGFDDPIADGIAEALLRTVIHALPIALKEPDNYDARADLLYASSIGIKTVTQYGKRGEWSCHGISHALTAYYGVNHGESLAIITPAWMEQVLCPDTEERFVRFGTNVFHLDHPTGQESIHALKQFFKENGLPQELRALGVEDTSAFKTIAHELAETRDYTKTFYPLTEEDLLAILNRSEDDG